MAVGYGYGTGAGAILTSPDGTAWTPQTSGVGNGSLNGITWSGSQFVAVGHDNSTGAGAILTSPDGITWTPQTSGLANGQLNGIVWSGSQFVAVGYGYGTGGGAILTSPNGTTWTRQTSGVGSATLFGIAGSGSQFVAVGYDSSTDTAVLTSPDGITWTPQLSGPSGRQLHGITWSGSQFVAVGDNGNIYGIFTSPNGTTWTRQISSVAGERLSGITWSGSQLVAVGHDNSTNGGAIVTSPDGKAWAVQTSGLANGQLNGIAWSGSQFVAVGTGPDAILTSPDGITWTRQTSGVAAEQLNGITWSGSQFVAVGQDYGTGGGILTSPNGITWTPQTSVSYELLYGIAWSGNQFVAVGYDYGTGGGILTSPDGITWTPQTSGLSYGRLYGIAWSGSQFVAVGQEEGTGAGVILTSPNGTTWTRETSGLANGQLNGIAWSGSQFVAVGQDNSTVTGVILTSPNGTTWTRQTSGVGNRVLYGITWSGSQFVVVGIEWGGNGAGVILTSACPWGDDFALANQRWTMIGLPAAPTTATVAEVFSDALGTNYPTDWVMYRRNYAPLQYQQLAIGDSVTQGTGYWIKNTTGDATLSLAAGTATAPLTTTNCPSTVGCYVIPLTAAASGNRYNLIGMPFPYPVGWWDAQVEVNGAAYPLGSTEANTYVDPTYWVWNGADYDVYDVTTPSLIGMLQPWQGVWVNVLSGSIGQTVKLLIPALPKTSQLSAPADPVAAAPTRGGWQGALDWLLAPAAAEETQDYHALANGRRGRDAGRDATGRAIQQGQAWYVRLIAEAPTLNMRSRNNVLGQLPDSAVGYDTHDLVKLAPFGSPYLTVVFPHPDWGTRAGDYASDYRSNRDSKARGLPAANWRFEIRTDTAGRVVQLRWEGPVEVLRRSELLDEETGARYKVNHPRYIEDGIPVTMSTKVRHFTWRYAGRPSDR